MTSSILPPRSVRGPCAPSTHATASTRFDFPDPFGPTTTVTPGSNSRTVLSANDLKPRSVNDLRNTRAAPIAVGNRSRGTKSAPRIVARGPRRAAATASPSLDSAPPRRSLRSPRATCAPTAPQPRGSPTRNPARRRAPTSTSTRSTRARAGRARTTARRAPPPPPAPRARPRPARPTGCAPSPSRRARSPPACTTRGTTRPAPGPRSAPAAAPAPAGLGSPEGSQTWHAEQ